MRVLSRNEVLEVLGDPAKVVEGLHAFRKTATVFSSKRAHLISQYPKRWVAVFDGNIIADGRSLQDVLSKVESAGYQREHVLVRYIDRTMRKMIL